MADNRSTYFDKDVNLTMLTDFYELTMGGGYFHNGFKDLIGHFDLFYRHVPDNGGFVIAAGLEQMVDYLNGLHFTEEDLDYLKGRGFADDFLAYLRDFEFACDVWAVPEGTPVFPNEPVMHVRGPVIQAQFVETALLMLFNHQSLIATKANRIVRAAKGRAVMEFGSRRAQGISGAVTGARAAYIGGCIGTACTVSDEIYGTPALGTMAHSWVQMFDSEYEAFVAYCKCYPNNATLLVDTFNSLKSGVPNAIRAFNEVLKPLGITKCGIRFDSGDMTYLTVKARKMLDEAGWPECKITVSNSLDERLITELLHQGAAIDSFGVGERLITSSSNPVFGGVYKLAAVEDEKGNIIPKIKISENTAKITNPGFKHTYRFYDKETGMAEADYICFHDEFVDDSKPITICDPEAKWKNKTYDSYVAKELLVPIFKNGELVYQTPSLKEIQAYCKDQVDHLWPEVLRFDNPHNYYVDLSERLMDLKEEMLNEGARKDQV